MLTLKDTSLKRYEESEIEVESDHQGKAKYFVWYDTLFQIHTLSY